MNPYIMICLIIVVVYLTQYTLLVTKLTGIEKMIIFHVHDFKQLDIDKQKQITTIVKINFKRMLLLHCATLILMFILVVNVKELYSGVGRVYPLMLLGTSLMLTSFDAVVTVQRIDEVTKK